MAKLKKDGTPRKPRTPKTKPGVPGTEGVAGLGHNSDKAKELTPDQQRALFLRHKTRYAAALTAKKAADADLKNVCNVIKAEGFTVDQIKAAIAFETPEGEAKETAKVKQILQAAAWAGVPLGTQLSLFEQPDRTPSVDVAYDKGKMASMQNQRAAPQDAGYAPGTEQYDHYMAGFHSHQRELAGGLKAPADVNQSTMAVHEADESSGGSDQQVEEYEEIPPILQRH